MTKQELRAILRAILMTKLYHSTDEEISSVINDILKKEGLWNAS